MKPIWQIMYSVNGLMFSVVLPQWRCDHDAYLVKLDLFWGGMWWCYNARFALKAVWEMHDWAQKVYSLMLENKTNNLHHKSALNNYFSNLKLSALTL